MFIQMSFLRSVFNSAQATSFKSIEEPIQELIQTCDNRSILNTSFSGGLIHTTNELLLKLDHAKGTNINASELSKLRDKVYSFYKLYGDNISNNDKFMQAIIKLIENMMYKQSKLNIYSNAFIKLADILVKFGVRKLFIDKIKHFDICSAPGYFVKCMQVYCKKYELDYDYNTCSYDAGLKYEKGVEHKIMMNILTDDYEQLIGTEHMHTFNLVTADGGTEHSYEMLAEEENLDLFEKEVEMAFKLLASHGVCIVKTYSLTNERMHKLVDNFSRHFVSSYVYKPSASRVINDELYLVGLDYSQKEILADAVDTNSKNIIEFEYKREDIRTKFFTCILPIIEKYRADKSILSKLVTVF